MRVHDDAGAGAGDRDAPPALPPAHGRLQLDGIRPARASSIVPHERQQLRRVPFHPVESLLESRTEKPEEQHAASEFAENSNVARHVVHRAREQAAAAVDRLECPRRGRATGPRTRAGCWPGPVLSLPPSHGGIRCWPDKSARVSMRLRRLVPMGSQPSPSSTTRRMAGALSPPMKIGGCGFCTGLGSKMMSEKFT